jgi:hypothetical protein
VLLYRYFVSQSNEFCHHNPLCCFSTSNTKGKRIFRYQLSPETFGYTLVQYPLSNCGNNVIKNKTVVVFLFYWGTDVAIPLVYRVRMTKKLRNIKIKILGNINPNTY